MISKIDGRKLVEVKLFVRDDVENFPLTGDLIEKEIILHNEGWVPNSLLKESSPGDFSHILIVDDKKGE